MPPAPGPAPVQAPTLSTKAVCAGSRSFWSAGRFSASGLWLLALGPGQVSSRGRLPLQTFALPQPSLSLCTWQRNLWRSRLGGHSLDWWSEGCHLNRRHLSSSVREEWGVGDGGGRGLGWVLPSGGRGSGPGVGVRGPGVSPLPPQVTLGPALQADLPDFCPRRRNSAVSTMPSEALTCHLRVAGAAEVCPQCRPGMADAPTSCRHPRSLRGQTASLALEALGPSPVACGPAVSSEQTAPGAGARVWPPPNPTPVLSSVHELALHLDVPAGGLWPRVGFGQVTCV